MPPIASPKEDAHKNVLLGQYLIATSSQADGSTWPEGTHIVMYLVKIPFNIVLGF